MNNINRRLYVGDNLKALRSMEDESVDLICVDPPFFKKVNFENRAGDIGFIDKWTSMEDFINFMRLRALEFRRLMKPTASLYWQADASASHYLKVMLDEVFGYKHFLNEIIWCKEGSGQVPQRHYVRKHESILFYAKRKGSNTFNKQYKPYSPGTIKKYKLSPDGLHRTIQRGKEYILEHGDGVALKTWWNDVLEASADEDIKSNILAALEGIGDSASRDYWTDILGFGTMSNSTEQVDYPTQKPLALYKRLVEVSSNPGDLVLDAFAGSGTSLIAAESTGRRWVGMELNESSVNIINNRLLDANTLLTLPNKDMEVIYND